MWRRVWLYPREGKRGTTWIMMWLDEFGRQHEQSQGPSFKVAESRRRAFELELNAGDAVMPSRMLLSEFAEEHERLMQGQLAAMSVKEHVETLACFKESVGDLRLHQITPRTIEAFYAARLAHVAVPTANKALRTLRAVFARARQRGLLNRNPADGIKPRREAEREKRMLSADELEALLQACPDMTWRALLFLGATTGMRLNEMAHLCWDDIDFEAGLIAVRCKDGRRTKSSRNRICALVPAAANLLQRLKATAKSEWVFVNGKGTRLGWNFSRILNRICARARVKRCRIKDLRSTCLSHLANAGVNEVVAQRMAGHASVTTTAEHYTKIVDDALHKAAAKLPYAAGFDVILGNSWDGQSDAQKKETA